MTLTVLFGGPPSQRAVWRAHLDQAARAAGLDMRLVMDPAETAPAEVDLIICSPEGPVQDFTPYTRLRAALNMWAGVETMIANPTLKAPLTRMVEHGLTEGMTEWVVGHVLRHHLGMDRHLTMAKGDWPQDHPPLARQRRVCILGLGELGADAARALAALRFKVTGWARSPRTIPGLACLSGPGALAETLARAEILVLLLPRTAATENLLNAERLALMPRGAAVLNPGRGALIDDAALIAALDAGRLSHATLDVFRDEPLPRAHPFWDHPKITVTPHIASATRPDTAAAALVAQIARAARGEPLLHVVERARGY